MFNNFKMRSSKYSLSQKRMAIVLVIFAISFVFCAFPPFSYAAYEPSEENASTDKEEKKIHDVYIRKFNIPKITANNEALDEDPLSSDFDQSFDTDPLSLDLLFPEDIDPLVIYFESNNFEDITVENISPKTIEKFAKYLELHVPYILHTDRDYSKLSELAIKIIQKVVYEEARFCPFEQQAAIAALILNRLYAEEYPDTIFDIVSAPNQFRESYAYAPFPEVSEKTRAAVECALAGIDFSCGAVAYYNPEFSTAAGIRYFEKNTTMCAHIVDNMNLVLCCLNEHADEVLAQPKYYY